MPQLPSTGFVRLSTIIGNPKKGIPAILPISRSMFWVRVKAGVYPAGTLLGPRTRGWSVVDVQKMIDCHTGNSAAVGQ
jgi:prophage regulatory protein